MPCRKLEAGSRGGFFKNWPSQYGLRTGSRFRGHLDTVLTYFRIADLLIG